MKSKTPKGGTMKTRTGRIEVVNRRAPKPGFSGKRFNVARPSVLGNPFKMQSPDDRERVIKQYRRWLWERLLNRDKRIMNALSEIYQTMKSGQNVELACYCPPQLCHADVIKQAIEWIAHDPKAARQRIMGRHPAPEAGVDPGVDPWGPIGLSKAPWNAPF